LTQANHDNWEPLTVYEYEKLNGQVSYILAKDDHEAADIAAMLCGGSQFLKDVRLSYEQ